MSDAVTLTRQKAGSSTPPRPRRQWGAERPKPPLPAVHDRPSTMKLILGRIAIWITVAMWMTYVFVVFVTLFFAGEFDTPWRIIEATSYVIVVTFLTFSALMYLVARQGAFERFRSHQRTPRAELDRHFSVAHRPLTVLVPSYAEEPSVISKTLWSAALQEYPSLRVVLLVDDNPNPHGDEAIARMTETRSIAHNISMALARPASQFQTTLDECVEMQDAAAGMLLVEEAYHDAVDWLHSLASVTAREDHVDDFFVDEVLLGLADDLESSAIAVGTAIAEGSILPIERVHELLRRLVWIFTADMATFERKRYASLSHEANKAMNLNSYIGLLGGRFVEFKTPKGIMLRPAGGGVHADLEVPYSDFVLTLDADSVLLRDYCLRLVHFLEQPENATVAVAQTPYSSFRGAPTRIERLAGATTDVQHILHQGMTRHNATFWVGANAVIRMEALDDILEIDTDEGFEVRRYVQDRTVIEDTESSIDLAVHGWKLVNYPERLSYSATPPDFGSLVVQRRRWANGGLLIFPKMWQQVRDKRRAYTPLSLGEVALRTNYMASIAWASLGLIFLLAYPYDNRLVSPFILLGALPYFIAMASDLKYCGYKRSDIFRIYGFNLILLPVNMAGVLKSLQQGLTGMKIPFARTPKVKDRTSTPLLYVFLPYVIVLYSAFIAWISYEQRAWGTLAFSTINAVLALWSIKANIGIRASIVDTWYGLTDWMWVEDAAQQPSPETAARPERDWRTVLHEGHPAPGTGGVAEIRRAAETRSTLGRVSSDWLMQKEPDASGLTVPDRNDETAGVGV